MTRRIVISALLVLLILAGCSTPEPTPTPAPTVAPTSTPEPATVTPPQTESSGITLSRDVPRISPEDLKEKMANGEDIMVGDTRAKREYESKRIAGAIWFPSHTVDSLDELDLDQEIILYCA